MELHHLAPTPTPTNNTQVVAELPPDGEAPRFDSFNLWGDFAGPESEFDDESGMVFHSCPGHFDHLTRARGMYCPVGACTGVPSADGAGGVKGGGRGASAAEEVFPSKGVGCIVCVNVR